MKTIYQINSKGDKVAKLINCKSDKDGVLYLLKICKKAVKISEERGDKDGAKYLRTLGISKGQILHFASLDKSVLKAQKPIRLGDFVKAYDSATLTDILTELGA